MFQNGNKNKYFEILRLPLGNVPYYFLWLRLLTSLFTLVIPCAVWAEQNVQSIRFGITPAIVHDQYELLEDFREYLQKKLQRPVEFVSRDSYRETIDLIKRKKLDFAWLSDYPYVYLENFKHVRLLSTPIFKGRPYYCAYLIVPASDLNTKSLLQLKGKVFAYADPYSNSGYLVPRFQLEQAGEKSSKFFRKTFYTWAHQRIIEAVAIGLADGGSVDSFVWDTMSVLQKELTDQTRIVSKSPDYGFPPIVASLPVDKSDYAAMQRVLLGMANDQEGARLLKRLQLDGFGPPAPGLYREVYEMMRATGEL